MQMISCRTPDDVCLRAMTQSYGKGHSMLCCFALEHVCTELTDQPYAGAGAVNPYMVGPTLLIALRYLWGI